MGIPASRKSRLAMSLSMATADPTTPLPTYGHPGHLEHPLHRAVLPIGTVEHGEGHIEGNGARPPARMTPEGTSRTADGPSAVRGRIAGSTRCQPPVRSIPMANDIMALLDEGLDDGHGRDTRDLMFLRSAAEENCNVRHSREVTGLSQGAPQATPLQSMTSVVASAAFWLAAGLMAGLVAAGGIPLSTGAPVAVGCAVVAMLATRRRSTARRPPCATRPIRDEAALTAAALGRAVGEFDRPEAGLEEMLRQIAGSIGSKTVLLLRPTDDGRHLP